MRHPLWNREVPRAFSVAFLAVSFCACSCRPQKHPPTSTSSTNAAARTVKPKETPEPFPQKLLILSTNRVSARRQLLAALQQAERRGDRWKAAEFNAMLGQESFLRVHRVLKAWEGLRDPATALIPKSLDQPFWNGDDVASDCFPFLLLASQYLDPPTRSLWLDTLSAERRLGGVLPRTLSLKDGRAREDAPYMLMFGGAEYAKDGLVSIAERLGRGPWFDRMEEIAHALIDKAAVQTAAGAICAEDTELNGDILQVFPRLYWATRKEEYLSKAERTTEAYLFDIFPKHSGMPAMQWDFATGKPSARRPNADIVKLRDHGNETILGLSEVYFLERSLGRPQAERYRAPLKKLYDTIVTTGRSADGLWYDGFRVPSMLPVGGVKDNWGYVALALQAFDMAEGTSVYAAELQRAMRAAASRKSYRWEGTKPDGYYDSIEGMIYLLQWYDLPECREWVNDEMEVMFAKQDPTGFIEGMYLDGNFIRTALLYGMYKTQGVMPEPWCESLQLGCVPDKSGGALHIFANAMKPWRGVLKLDYPRHRVIWNMPANYARLNSSPEWFVVEPDRSYEVENADSGQRTEYRGSALTAGLAVDLDGERPVRLIVRPKP